MATLKKKGLGRRTIKGSSIIRKPKDEEHSPVLDAESGQSLKALERIIEDIKDSHNDALQHATGIVVAAAQAGEKLLEAKNNLPDDTNFSSWIEKNLPFKWRTGYDYVRIHEGISRHSIDPTACNSIREVLKLISSAEGKETKPKDPKTETWVSHVGAIEKFFDGEIEKSPIDEWPEKTREMRKGILKNIAAYYRKL
jgi:hypothetical protein